MGPLRFRADRDMSESALDEAFNKDAFIHPEVLDELLKTEQGSNAKSVILNLMNAVNQMKEEMSHDSKAAEFTILLPGFGQHHVREAYLLALLATSYIRSLKEPSGAPNKMKVKGIKRYSKLLEMTDDVYVIFHPIPSSKSVAATYPGIRHCYLIMPLISREERLRVMKLGEGLIVFPKKEDES